MCSQGPAFSSWSDVQPCPPISYCLWPGDPLLSIPGLRDGSQRPSIKRWGGWYLSPSRRCAVPSTSYQAACSETIVQPHPPLCLPRSFQRQPYHTVLPWAQEAVHLPDPITILSASRGPEWPWPFPHHEGTCASLDSSSHDHNCPTRQGLPSLVAGEHSL